MVASNIFSTVYVLLQMCKYSRHVPACHVVLLHTIHYADCSFFCRLAAAIGLQCALALSAAQVQVTTNSQAQALCWSAAEVQETFETVLWALSQHDEVPHAGSRLVTGGLQHMELNEGDFEPTCVTTKHYCLPS